MAGDNYKLITIRRENNRVFVSNGIENKFEISLNNDHAVTVKALIGMLKDGRLKRDERKYLGLHLYRVLLSNDLGMIIDQAVQNAVSSPIRIDLRFNMDSEGIEELIIWPWEHLFMPKENGNILEGDFFIEIKDPDRKKITFTRSVNPTERIRTTEHQSLDLLILASDKSESYETTFNHLKERFKSTEAASLTPNLIFIPEEQATWKELKRTLKQSHVQILHFLCPVARKDGEIVLELADSRNLTLDPIPATDLENLIRDHRSIELIILQATESASPEQLKYIALLAARLARVVPAVISFQYKLEAEITSDFLSEFYNNALVMSIADAMETAWKKFADEAYICGFPVLYLNDPELRLNISSVQSADEYRRPGPIAPIKHSGHEMDVGPQGDGYDASGGPNTRINTSHLHTLLNKLDFNELRVFVQSHYPDVYQKISHETQPTGWKLTLVDHIMRTQRLKQFLEQFIGDFPDYYQAPEPNKDAPSN